MQFKRGEYGKGECETNTDCGSLVIEWLAIFLGQLWFNAYSSILYLFSQILAKFCECLRISIILCIAAEAEKLGFLGQMQMETFVAIGISSSIWNLFNTIFFFCQVQMNWFYNTGIICSFGKVISGWQIPYFYMAKFGGFSELVLKKCAHSPPLSSSITKINLSWYLSLPLHYCILCNKIKGHWNNTQTPKKWKSEKGMYFKKWVKYNYC